MDTHPIQYTQWSDRLAMDIALLLERSGDTIEDILDRHHITIDDLARYNTDRVFLRKVGHLRNEIREKGMTFRLKARAQAEELLTTSWTLIHSTDVSAAVKADLIKATVKWGGLEPTKDTGDAATGEGVRITINIGGDVPPVQVAPSVLRTIEHEPAE